MQSEPQPIPAAGASNALPRGTFQFTPEEGAPLIGVIGFLTEKYGGNPARDRLITAITSDLSCEAPASVIADLENKENRFVSVPTSKGWVGYDLRPSELTPSHYALQSHKIPYLQSWAFEGSIDGKDWFILDSHTNSSALTEDFKIATFPVASPRVCTRVRIRQTGPSYSFGTISTTFFTLAALELFGTFKMVKRGRFSTNTNLRAFCLAKKFCTYAIFGPRFVVQKWYHCKPCLLTRSLGCCYACSGKCHSGHDISFSGENDFAFCDCGDQLRHRCRCFSMDFPSTGQNPFNGIIAFLTELCNGNVDTEGMAFAITDCELDPDLPAKYIANFHNPDKRFLSGHTGKGWVGYNFVTSSILPTHYSLQSHLIPFLRAWVLEGTLDEVKWFVLDSRPDNGAISVDYKVATFAVAEPRACRRIRVKQTGPSMSEEGYAQDFFALSAFELFGTFYPGPPP
jgi:hypothetical protein